MLKSLNKWDWEKLDKIREALEEMACEMNLCGEDQARESENRKIDFEGARVISVIRQICRRGRCSQEHLLLVQIL